MSNLRNYGFQKTDFQPIDRLEKVFPIEIKSGPTGSLRSLHQLIEASNLPFAVRIYGGELRIEEAKTPLGTPYKLLNLPYYLGTLIREYTEWFVESNQG